jgi:hypothetical protein
VGIPPANHEAADESDEDDEGTADTERQDA